MFISFLKDIIHKLQVNKTWKRWVAYGIVIFLIMQNYFIPFASQESTCEIDTGTIGDATHIDADFEDEKADVTVEVLEDAVQLYSSALDYYRITPDTKNPFVAYAMTIPRGSGKKQDNLCATYVSKALYGYYGQKAAVSGMTRVIQISNQLEATENWECVYKDVNCFTSAGTDEQYDRLFDSLTNSGDVVCFVNKSFSDQVHCAIAGGGSALVGHLTSSGWDSVRASYYLANAVDKRKICTGMMVFRYKEVKPPGTVQVCKNYDESLYRTDPVLYDISGANYGVYTSVSDAKAMKNAVGYCYIEPGEPGQAAADNISTVAYTELNGGGIPVELPEGTYYIREVTPPVKGGWLLDSNIYETRVVAGQHTLLGQPRNQNATAIHPEGFGYEDNRIVGPEMPYLGYISLSKQVYDSYKDMLSGNENYTYADIEYTVYRVSGNQQTDIGDVYGVFSIDKQGQGIVTSCRYDSSCLGKSRMGLPLGWYMIQETKTNDCMELNKEPKWVEITNTNQNVTHVVMEDLPVVARTGLLLRKCGEDGLPVAHALYRVLYYTARMDQNPSEFGIQASKAWMFQTDEQGEIYLSQEEPWFVEGDSLFTDKDGSFILPAGTITVQEIQAPDGYVVDPTVYVRKISPGNDGRKLAIKQEITVVEEGVRGDIKFRKVNEDGTPLSNIKFSITDVYGESHIVWTDEEGYFSSEASYISHEKDTNSGQTESGIWFGSLDVDDTKGALPYGKYTIEELRCEANKDKYRTMEPQTFEITEHGTVIDLGDFVNLFFPEIRTKAYCEESQFDLESFQTENQIFCIDTVEMENLDVGHTYTISGQPYRKDTGEMLDQELWSCSEESFQATATDGCVDVTYTLKMTEELYDTEIVFFETMTDEAYPGEVVARHEDLADMAQTIYIPPKPEMPPEPEEEEQPVKTLSAVRPHDVQPEVKTGDDAHLFLILLIASTSLVAVVMMLTIKRRKKKK